MCYSENFAKSVDQMHTAVSRLILFHFSQDTDDASYILAIFTRSRFQRAGIAVCLETFTQNRLTL